MQAADLSRSREGQRYFLARGCFHVPEGMSSSKLHLLFKRVAGVSEAVVRQLSSLAEFDVQAYCPPAAAGVSPTAMPAETHFHTFIAAFVAALRIHTMRPTLPRCEALSTAYIA